MKTMILNADVYLNNIDNSCSLFCIFQIEGDETNPTSRVT